jgi:hypothetical protein
MKRKEAHMARAKPKDEEQPPRGRLVKRVVTEEFVAPTGESDEDEVDDELDEDDSDESENDEEEEPTPRGRRK